VGGVLEIRKYTGNLIAFSSNSIDKKDIKRLDTVVFISKTNVFPLDKPNKIA
jgi:hypothetical protein